MFIVATESRHTLKFSFFHALGILSHGERINHGLDVATKETLQVVRGIADTMVGHAKL